MALRRLSPKVKRTVIGLLVVICLILAAGTILMITGFTVGSILLICGVVFFVLVGIGLGVYVAYYRKLDQMSAERENGSPPLKRRSSSFRRKKERNSRPVSTPPPSYPSTPQEKDAPWSADGQIQDSPDGDLPSDKENGKTHSANEEESKNDLPETEGLVIDADSRLTLGTITVEPESTSTPVAVHNLEVREVVSETSSVNSVELPRTENSLQTNVPDEAVILDPSKLPGAAQTLPGTTGESDTVSAQYLAPVEHNLREKSSSLLSLNAQPNSLLSLTKSSSLLSIDASSTSQQSLNIPGSRHSLNVVSGSQPSLNALSNSQLSLNARSSSQLSLNDRPSSQLSINARSSSQLSLNIRPSSQLSMNARSSSEVSLNPDSELVLNVQPNSPKPELQEKFLPNTTSSHETNLLAVNNFGSVGSSNSTQAGSTKETPAMQGTGPIVDNVTKIAKNDLRIQNEAPQIASQESRHSYATEEHCLSTIDEHSEIIYEEKKSAGKHLEPMDPPSRGDSPITAYYISVPVGSSSKHVESESSTQDSFSSDGSLPELPSSSPPRSIPSDFKIPGNRQMGQKKSRLALKLTEGKLRNVPRQRFSMMNYEIIETPLPSTEFQRPVSLPPIIDNEIIRRKESAV
ncbi:uncharacterized protein LOC143018199 [Oratosquilla oratoria]|uniref:uncharacterized protein LOC143018199 n=1 Tax=Oratosquilla oratoria TaxID=337810 RepID=UPI003F764468